MTRAPVLLVDDDEFARAFARAVIERAGFEVIEAGDVAEGLAAGSRNLSAVVTDWNLPDGHGGDLARSLHERSKELPVILVTGEADLAEEMPDGVKQEFASILRKPYPPSALEKAIRSALLNAETFVFPRGVVE